MDPKDDMVELAIQQSQDIERDDDLRKKYRRFDEEGEILARRSREDRRTPTQIRVDGLLGKAIGAISMADLGLKGYTFERVVELADEALQLEPSNARALMFRALAEAKLGLLGRALEDAQRAMTLDPEAFERAEKAICLDPDAMRDLFGELRQGFRGEA
jgi:hypothetical protein